MTKKQKELLNKILVMPVGTTLKKGNRQRIIVGFDGFMIYYKTKVTSKKTTGLNVQNFLKWAEDADIGAE